MALRASYLCPAAGSADDGFLLLERYHVISPVCGWHGLDCVFGLSVVPHCAVSGKVLNVRWIVCCVRE